MEENNLLEFGKMFIAPNYLDNIIINHNYDGVFNRIVQHDGPLRRLYLKEMKKRLMAYFEGIHDEMERLYITDLPKNRRERREREKTAKHKISFLQRFLKANYLEISLK